ncbi:MAG TPA: GNAT family N-acetyltransferase [Gammaproteobacteria bacterium]
MPYHIKLTDWANDAERLGDIRRTVFIEEQKVPENLEWDESDAKCTHVLVTDNNNKPLATARITNDGHIGRMAVLKAHRKRGIGSGMLKQLIDHARELELRRVTLNAQISAMPFYASHGFIAISDEFVDAGIPHKTMQLEL